MSTIVIFGGNVGVTPLIHSIKKSGYEVLVLGHDPGQMGCKRADRFKKINYRKLESIREALSDENDIAGYVPGAHDLCYLAYAKYLDHLSGHDDFHESRFELLHNKTKFRDLLKKIAPERCPDFMAVTAFFESEKEDALFPALYKPDHAGGGYGIEHLKSWDEAVSRLGTKNVDSGILERFVAGEDYSISIWLKSGRAVFFHADREVSEGAKFKISGSVTSSALMCQFDEMGIPDELAGIVSEMGLRDGFVHCQIRMQRPGVWYLVEITLRMPGDCYSYVPEWFSGFDYSGHYLSAYIPEIIKPRSINKINRPIFPDGHAYGRVCLSPGDLLVDIATPYISVFSHEKSNNERYKIQFYSIQLSDEIDIRSNAFRLTRASCNYE
jgi:hypothetical protein